MVDPQPEIEPYLEAAAQKAMRITHIFETHVQADHVSGARRLAEVTRAPILVHESAPVVYPHVDVIDGEEHELGNVRVTVLHTPGHTPDSISLLVTDRTRGPEPWFVLTGDTLFAGGVGRPDLFGGSACGKGLSGKPGSTIGFERRFNPALQLTAREDFVRFVLADLPAPPVVFAENRRRNLGLE